MHNKRFTKRNLHGRIAHELGKRIVGGRYEPGDLLPPEAAIGQEMAVSRTALREAFKVLTAKGLIESRPKVGTRVRARKDWNMLDPDVLSWSFATKPSARFLQSLFEMRRVFEPSAAAMAAKRRTAVQLADIEAAYLSMERATLDTDEMLTTDLSFHLSILNATDNEFMISLGMMIETALIGSFSLSSSKPRAITDALAGHKAIYLGIRNSDPKRARFEMETLLDKSVTDALSMLEATNGGPLSAKLGTD